VDIEIREARFDEPEVRKLIADALGDLSRRYGGSGDDTPVAVTDFLPPNGRFFVAFDGAEDFGYYKEHAGVLSYARELWTDPDL
jgi:hypothetical protein